MIQTSKFIIYATTNFLLAESEEENENLLHSLADGVNKQFALRFAVNEAVCVKPLKLRQQIDSNKQVHHLCNNKLPVGGKRGGKQKLTE